MLPWRVYWKPVWNILEGQFTLVLAKHVKNVPGCKTDTKDSEWLAELLQHGLLAGSFVPPRLIRDLRDLTRTRAVLTQESSRIASRIQKVLEDANIKLASVASDTLGKSAQAMLAALIAGQSDPVQLADRSGNIARQDSPVTTSLGRFAPRTPPVLAEAAAGAVALWVKRDRVD
jgi:hypothetical protein